MYIKLKRLSSIKFIIFAMCFLLASSFIIGCGDEGDPVTDMVNGNGDPTTDPDPVDPPPDPVDPPPEPTVTFKNDIMPILTESCAFVGCHAAPGASGLNLSDYDTFKNGGNGGAAFVAGNGKDSLVVKYLDGREQPQMPAGGVPLTNDQIQLFIDWIDEGALNN